MSIGEQIRNIRYTEARLSQVALAKKVNITPHHLRMIEGGRSAPSLDVLERLLKELGYSLKIEKA